MTYAATGPFDLYLRRNFIDTETCERLIAELSASHEAPATVYGRGEGANVDERTRKVARISPSQDTIAFITAKLMEARTSIAEHFGLELDDCESPQFLRYGEGAFFVAHQDGGTGMLRSQIEQSRKASVVIFLNAQSDGDEAGTFAGGVLRFTEWRANRECGEFELRAEVGMLVAFLPDLTHEVLPVVSGERYSIASWFV